MAKKKATSKNSQTASFETSLESLNGVVQQLEEGQLSLSDSLEQYEQGVKHLKNCHAALKSAQRKIELLVKLDKDGNLVTQDFDDSATENVSGTRRKSSSRKPKPSTRSAEQQEYQDDLTDEAGEASDTDDSASLF